MLPSQMRAILRREANKTLTDTCTIERKGNLSNSIGYGESDWNVVATVNCRLLPLTQRDQKGQVALREANRVYFRLELAYDAEIQNGDRVKIDGATYEVLQISKPTDAMFTDVQVARKS
jgi:head-tail adaptor